jgi:hypothetical protein
MNNIVGFSPSSNRQLIPVADIEMFEARTAVMRRTEFSAEAKVLLERKAIVKGRVWTRCCTTTECLQNIVDNHYGCA